MESSETATGIRAALEALNEECANSIAGAGIDDPAWNPEHVIQLTLAIADIRVIRAALAQLDKAEVWRVKTRDGGLMTLTKRGSVPAVRGSGPKIVLVTEPPR